jgi:hypothetical protein
MVYEHSSHFSFLWYLTRPTALQILQGYGEQILLRSEAALQRSSASVVAALAAPSLAVHEPLERYEVTPGELEAGTREPAQLLAIIGDAFLEPRLLDLRDLLPPRAVAQTPHEFEIAVGSSRDETQRLHLILDHRLKRALAAPGAGVSPVEEICCSATETCSFIATSIASGPAGKAFAPSGQ